MVLEHVHVIKRSNSKNPQASMGENVVHTRISITFLGEVCFLAYKRMSMQHPYMGSVAFT